MLNSVNVAAGRLSDVRVVSKFCPCNHQIVKVRPSVQNGFQLVVGRVKYIILKQVPSAWVDLVKLSTKLSTPWVFSTSNQEPTEMTTSLSTKKTSSNVPPLLTYLIDCLKSNTDYFFPITAFLHNFDKQSLVNTTYDFEYDYKSIMHYGTHFFRY